MTRISTRQACAGPRRRSLGCRSSQLPDREPSFELGPPIDRTVTADQRWPELAMAAVSDPTLHVALHRGVDAVAWETDVRKRRDGEPHHHLGTARHRDHAGR